jgi:hypothetical protein
LPLNASPIQLIDRLNVVLKAHDLRRYHHRGPDIKLTMKSLPIAISESFTNICDAFPKALRDHVEAAAIGLELIDILAQEEKRQTI